MFQQQYEIRLPIHRLNATTDMVKNVATAVDYLHQLDNYIKSDTTVQMNKALAIEHRVKTINRTVEAYKYVESGQKTGNVILKIVEWNLNNYWFNSFQKIPFKNEKFIELKLYSKEISNFYFNN